MILGSPSSPQSTDPRTDSPAQPIDSVTASKNCASSLTDVPISNPSSPACEVETRSSGTPSQPTVITDQVRDTSPPATKASGDRKHSGKVKKFIENDIELFPRLLLAAEPEPRVRRKARALARGTDYTRSSSESNLVRRDMKSIDSFLVVFSFFEKTTYCCRARRLSVRLSVRPSVCPSVRLWK